jgi:hypothetical protein
LLGGAGCASATPPADPNLTCSLAKPALYANSLEDLPEAVRAALLKSSGAMADRGEFFNAGDAISRPGPFNRFIRGGGVGRSWFAWYEHGGIAYWHQIVIFTVDPKAEVHIVANQRATQPNLCAETDRLLGSD